MMFCGFYLPVDMHDQLSHIGCSAKRGALISCSSYCVMAREKTVGKAVRLHYNKRFRDGFGGFESNFFLTYDFYSINFKIIIHIAHIQGSYCLPVVFSLLSVIIIQGILKMARREYLITDMNSC